MLFAALYKKQIYLRLNTLMMACEKCNSHYQYLKFRGLFTIWSKLTWYPASLHWRHIDHDGVSNHQPHGCLLNRLFRRRWKKTSKLRFTGLCVGNSPGPVNSPHKRASYAEMFPFDDVIMYVIHLNGWNYKVRRFKFSNNFMIGFGKIRKWSPSK